MIKITRDLINIIKDASGIITDDFIVNAKDDNGDLVTNFDYEVEKYIISKLNELYPNYDIVSEEYNSDGKVTENCFVIDPIDGTINFAHNLPLWGIQVACISGGKTVSSVIYLPKLNEMYYADESGAYLNDKRIYVSNLPPKKSLNNIMLEKPMTLPKVCAISRHYRCIYSVAVACAWIAKGSMGGINVGIDTPWDYIPGQYLVEMAGGYTYNKPGMHISANTKEMLEALINSETIGE